MRYQYAVDRRDGTDLASGRVLYHLPGRPALPIRLAEEVYCRCRAACLAGRSGEGVSLYDPCCGAAYHLTVLALLHRSEIREVVGSDVDPDAVRLARKNLALTDPDGIGARIAEIRLMVMRYDKQSHREALESAERILARLSRAAGGAPLGRKVFVADALQADPFRAHLAPGSVDIVMTDVPYGEHSQWRSPVLPAAERAPAWMLLEALRGVLRPHGVVGLVCNKSQRPQHEAYDRVERFQIGRRRVEILELARSVR